MGEQPVLDAEFESRLSALGVDPSVLLTAEDVALEQAAAALAKPEGEVQAWLDAVRSVHEDTAALREDLEARLKESIDSGEIRTRADAARKLAEIDQQVARGPERSYTYNHSSDPMYKKTQPYFVTVDKHGNIWGEFPYTEKSSRVSQYPVSAGKHIMRRNPTL